MAEEIQPAQDAALGRSRAWQTRNKWVMNTDLYPGRLFGRTLPYFEINERGFGPRLNCLANINGPVAGTGAPDKFLSLVASLHDAKAAFLVDLNPYNAEAVFPYYTEAILHSKGDPQVLSSYLDHNDELLAELYILTQRKYRDTPYESAQGLIEDSKRAFSTNQNYLGLHSWVRHGDRLMKLFRLAEAGRLRAYTADHVVPGTWDEISRTLERWELPDTPRVMDVSNIHSIKWEGTKLINTLRRVFPQELPELIILGSGSVPNRTISTDVFTYGNGKKITHDASVRDLARIYRSDPVLGQYYLKQPSPWKESLSGGLLDAWISKGLWALIRDANPPLS